MSDRPLSILHVLLTGGWGGSERHCLDLIRMQQAAGHRVGLVLRPRSREPVTTYDYLPETGNGPQEQGLSLLRDRGREAVGIDGVVV